MSDPRPYKDSELVYSATARCPCGAGMAYVPGDLYWDCSDILTNRAIHRDLPGSKTHTDRLPFIFYKIKSEGQPSAGGATTRA
jgi:hypothetical protein